jgi:hypothetical protein
MALRALAALAALFLLFVATRFWLDPVAAAAGMGLAPHGPLGLATLRADNAGAFGAIGLFALFGAVRGDGRLFVPPLVFLGIAIAGRILTLAVVGMSPPLVPPMVIEAVLIALFAANRWALGKI